MSRTTKPYAVAHAEGRVAFHNGDGLRKCPYEPWDAASRYWQDGWECGRGDAALAKVAEEAAAKVNAVVDAIEAFVDAKIAYERRRVSDPEWASSTDVNETRDHLRDKLIERAS